MVMPFLHELRQRDGLRVALSGRDENTLTPILVFIARYINKQLHTKFLCEILDIILGMKRAGRGRGREGRRKGVVGRDWCPFFIFFTYFSSFLLPLSSSSDIYGSVVEKGTGIALQMSKIRNQINVELAFQVYILLSYLLSYLLSPSLPPPFLIIPLQESFLPLLGSLELIINSAIATMPIEAVAGSPGTPLMMNL